MPWFSWSLFLEHLVLFFSLLFPVTVISRRNTVTAQPDACRPNAFTYCELPIITSLNADTPYPAFPGEEMRVHCQAFGSPTPVITWYRANLPNGESIDVPTVPGSHMINEAGTLRIRHVVPHDDGKYFCMASNSVGDAKILIEIKVSHPMVSLIPLTVGNTFVTLTWNGTVQITSEKATSHRTTHSSARHHHHMETRYRLSRHLLLKYRRYSEALFSQSDSVTTTTVKLSATARQFTVVKLQPSTAYEFCIEFQPHDRPSTLLDCVILRTTLEAGFENNPQGAGYHQGQTILFLLIIVIVGGVSSVCVGCYSYAIGRRLWKYRNKKTGGFSSMGYSYRDDRRTSGDYDAEAMHDFSYYEDNPKRPLIARI